MRHNYIPFRLALALCATISLFGLGGCDNPSTSSREATATPPSTLTAAPPTPTRGLALPAEATILHEQHADINGDGVEERAVAFHAVSGDGIAIDDWQALLPPGQRIEELQIRPMDMMSGPKVLLLARGEDGFSYYLYIYAWDGATYAGQGPVGGPLDGQAAFRSAYYPPAVEDGDYNGAPEIALCLEADHPDFVRVVFYEWDGQAFAHSTLFIAIPRHIPEKPKP